MNLKLTLGTLNFALFVIGMVGVWYVTNSGWALFWTWIASFHITLGIDSPDPRD